MQIKTKIWKKNNLLGILKMIKIVDGRYIYVIIFTTVIVSILPPASLKIMQAILNILQTDISNLNNIFALLIIYLTIDLIQIVLENAIGYYKTKFQLNFNLFLKKSILEKSSKLNLKDYENSKLYDMIQRAEQQGDGQLILYFDTVIDSFGMIITSISYLAIVMGFKEWIIPILVVIPVFRFIVSYKINREEFIIDRKRTDDVRKAWYYSYIITSGINYKELRLYNLFSHFKEKYILFNRCFNKQDIKIAKKRMMWFLAFNLFEQILTGVLFGYVIYCGYLGAILIGDVITYTRAMISAKGQVQSVISTFATLNKSSLFINQLFEFLNLEEKKEDGNRIIREIESIEVKHLYYKYDNSEKYALFDVNFKVKKGEFIAIVGRNGSGKTTLMKVIMGYYCNYTGSIFVNGINLKEINKESFLNNIGALFQDFTKYEGTIRENICYGNMKTKDDDKEIDKACKQFGLESLVHEQLEGIDTQLGFWFESGKQISLGQWQKVALTRTFMRDADLYILDEPNAALDSISEYGMAKLYKQVFRNKIGIVVVHKFNNFINDADNVIVLKDGQIIENGEHSELIEHSEEYKQLYNLQL